MNLFLIVFVSFVGFHRSLSSTDILQSIPNLCIQSAEQKYPEFLFSTDQLIEYLGYPVETHEVTTDDGYILRIFRIPHGRNDSNVGKRPPVCVLHGVLGSSDDIVINNASQSLGFMLADAGYDVWLGNFRGNKYCLKHTEPVPSHHDFFQFSFDEMAEYDVPAIIEYVLENTNYTDVQVVGLSMGTTAVFALLASRPEYNQKVRQFHACAPITLLDHGTSPAFMLAPFIKIIQCLANLLDYVELMPNSTLSLDLGCFCNAAPKLCKETILLTPNLDHDQFNSTRLPVYASHSTSGTSLNTVIHYGQIYNSHKFRKYDHGVLGNLKKYGQASPPLYALANVTVPVYIYWGANDPYADPLDVQWLRDSLSNCVDFYEVPDPAYGHVDFSLAMDNKNLLNDYLISNLEKY